MIDPTCRSRQVFPSSDDAELGYAEEHDCQPTTPLVVIARALDNYLRRHRRRAGFTQDELAYLLGCRAGSKVCRYESFTRQPSLPTALACEVIFQVPVRELFAGLYQQAERRVRRRAVLLQRRSGRAEHLKTRSQMLAALQHLVGGRDVHRSS